MVPPERRWVLRKEPTSLWGHHFPKLYQVNPLIYNDLLSCQSWEATSVLRNHQLLARTFYEFAYEVVPKSIELKLLTER